MKIMRKKERFINCLSLITLCALVLTISASKANADALDERERGALLEKTLVQLYFYPLNRLLDLRDIVQIGIAGSLGLGVEVGGLLTPHDSYGAYYVAQEKGIAYHGHRRNISWLDNPLWGVPFPTGAELLPGLDNHNRMHEVEHGYVTASFGNVRYESEDNENRHFKRFNNRAAIDEVMVTEKGTRGNEQHVMSDIDRRLSKNNESALRLEIVTPLLHPYIAFERYEVRDFITGFFFLDLKDDDLEFDAGRNKLRKLGRGITNIVTGPIELPLNILEVDRDDGGFAAITYGTMRGAWRFLVRSAFVGPWEVLTFPTNTDSIIEPEFPFLSSSAETSWRVKYK